MRVALPLSGGIDSTAALFYLVENGHQVFPISLDYGQKSSTEIEHAAILARFVGSQLFVETLLGKFPKCSRINSEIPIPEQVSIDSPTVECEVPGLYVTILSSSIRHGILNSCDYVCLPFTVASLQFYPEASKVGIAAASALVHNCSSRAMKALVPFPDASKLTLLKMLAASGAPYWLTYSCLEGGNHCGLCPKCVIRDSVFEAARSMGRGHFG